MVKSAESNSAAHINNLTTPPIFVVGAARSGTTWVYDILTAHPEVAGAFETFLFSKSTGLSGLFAQELSPPKVSRLGRLLCRDELIRHTRDFVADILSHALKSGHRFIVEKTPSHVYSMPLIKEIFPQARFIHVIRDGRDVNVSVKFAAKSWQKVWRESFGRSTATSAKHWKTMVKRGRHHGKNMKGDYLEIRYEELHKDPIASYRRLFDFCGIPYDDNLLQDIYERSDFKKRFKLDQQKFRRAGRVGDWKRYFTLWDAYRFYGTAGDMLLELGYEQDRGWLRRAFLGLLIPTNLRRYPAE